MYICGVPSAPHSSTLSPGGKVEKCLEEKAGVLRHKLLPTVSLDLSHGFSAGTGGLAERLQPGPFPGCG